MSARFALPVALASTLGVAVVIGYWPVRLWHEGWLDLLADDAFFYFIIAKNLATQGLSSFDGGTLTNGYQPLWQAVLAVQYLLASGSLAPTVFVEVAAVTVAAFLAFRAVGRETFWCLPLCAALLAALVDYPLILDGMETSLLFLTFAAFVLALRQTTQSDETWLPMAICGGLAVAARLDSIFFVVAALLLVPARAAQTLKALLLLAVCGAIYCGANKLVFDAWVPVSGTIKSLGAFGRINHALTAQLAELWPADLSPAKAAIAFSRSLPGRTLCLAGVTTILVLLFPRRQSFGWRVALAMVLGFVPFAARLLWFTSWRAWEWYDFPIFFFLVADFLLLATLLRTGLGLLGAAIVALAVTAILSSSTILTIREALLAGIGTGLVAALVGRGGMRATIAKSGLAALGVVLIAMTAMSVSKARPRGNPTIALFSKPLAEEIRGRIGLARVAMADRAAAFAYFYGGSLTQLEGLVNDREYLDTVTAHRPLVPLLCRRGVAYLISFERDLGDYSSHVVHPFRPALTMFDGPTITVARSDEVARIDDAVRYGVRDPDPIVYVWRLPECPKG